MKRGTIEKNTILANKIMFYIYTHIDTEINLDTLANELQISKFHMHRIFKEAFNRNIYESIKSIRLQKASNLLITNKYSTISEIGNECGYSSHSSFIRAFKERFGTTPKAWRAGAYKAYSESLFVHSEYGKSGSGIDFSEIIPEIVQMPRMQAYYIRHHGYNKSMKQTWQKLHTWKLTHGITQFQEVGLYHDNPSITPHNQCQYIACLITQDTQIEHSRLPQFEISEGIYAKFDLQGVYGDILKLVQYIFHEWLPQSDYETTTKPSYAIHRKNHFLSEDGKFDISFYVSIKY